MRIRNAIVVTDVDGSTTVEVVADALISCAGCGGSHQAYERMDTALALHLSAIRAFAGARNRGRCEPAGVWNGRKLGLHGPVHRRCLPRHSVLDGVPHDRLPSRGLAAQSATPGHASGCRSAVGFRRRPGPQCRPRAMVLSTRRPLVRIRHSVDRRSRRPFPSPLGLPPVRGADVTSPLVIPSRRTTMSG